MMKNYPDYELSAADAELLSAYIDEMLDEPERSAFEQRLADDALLQAELEAWQATLTLMNTLPELIAPRDFTLTPEMLERLDADNTSTDAAEPKLKVVPRKRKRRTNWLPALSAASMMLVAFGFFAIFTANNNDAPLTEAGESVAYAATQLGAADSRTLQNMSVDPLPTLESNADLNLQGAGVAQATLFEMDANDNNAFGLDDPADGVVDEDGEAPPPAPVTILQTTAPESDSTTVAANSAPQAAPVVINTITPDTENLDNVTADTDGDLAPADIAGTVEDVVSDEESPSDTTAGLAIPDESDMAESDHDDDEAATSFFEPEDMSESTEAEVVMSEEVADETPDEAFFSDDIQQPEQNRRNIPVLNEQQTRLITAISQIVATLIVLAGAG